MSEADRKQAISEFTGGDLMRAADVAEYFGCSLPNVYTMIRQNRIPVVRIGRSVRVSKRALEAWIEEQSRESVAA